MRFRSTNPVFKKMSNMEGEYAGVSYQEATYRGVAAKSLFYILLTFAGAFLSIFILVKKPEMISTMLPVVVIFGFILSMVAMMKPNATKIAGSIYCVLEGMLVGLVSFLFEAAFTGIVLSALVGTLSVVLVVSVVYMTGMVKVTGKFVKFLVTFAISFMLTYFLVWILSLIFPVAFSAAFSNPLIMIGVSAIIILLASLYLIFDMENIKNIVEGGQPKEMEWYAAFGLIFTVIWLYMEILRLFIIIFGSRDS